MFPFIFLLLLLFILSILYFHFISHFFRGEKEEPILSIPSVHGGEDIMKSMKFLVLMSCGVYIAYEQATGVPKDQVYLCLLFNPFKTAGIITVSRY